MDNEQKLYDDNFATEGQLKRTYRTGEVTQLRRIADTLDDIVMMIKADQERSKKYMEDNKSE